MGDEDSQLIEAYLRDGSEAAFGQLVTRYERLVYSSAVRQLNGDRHLAEDVTQAVFIVLARKAHTLRKGASLGAWLVTVTAYAAANARRREASLKVREREAAQMQEELRGDDNRGDVAINGSPADSAVTLLDKALPRLKERERSVIVMHFLEGRTFDDIAASLGISRDAASKRSSRGVEKLRDIFARAGVAMPAIALTELLMHLPIHALPDTLSGALAKTALTGASAHASGSAAALARGVIHATTWSGPKIAGTIAATVVIGAIVAAAVIGPARQNNAAIASSAPASDALVSPSTLPATQPAPAEATVIHWPLLFFGEKRAGDYDHGWDAVADKGGRTIGFIKYVATSSNPAAGASYNGGINPIPYRGKRMRVTVNMKATDVVNWGSMWVALKDANGKQLGFDNMSGRSLHETTDWRRLEIVMNVPQECTGIPFGLMLIGPGGEVKFDEPVVSVVGDEVETTDDKFHGWYKRPGQYTIALDRDVQRNGHPTMRIASTTAGVSDWAYWIKDDYDVSKYLGKKMRVSAMIKTQGVPSYAQLSIRVMGRGFKYLIPESQGAKKIGANSDWTKYETVVDVPEKTELFSNGVILHGPGTIWVDDIRWEAVE